MTATLEPRAQQQWVGVCTKRQLMPERGVAVLVGEAQVALFLVTSGDDEFVYAVGHRDPFCDANVIARGIVGSVGDRDTVTSPMYKHVFDLATGQCLMEPDVRLPVYRTWIAGGIVYVQSSPSRPGVDPVVRDPASVETGVPV